MTQIRVNPNQLIKKGDEILNISVQLKSITRAVFDSASSAPGYHDFFRGDQFGHEVFELGQNAFNMGTARVNQLEDDYKDIVLRAAAFIGADTTSDYSMMIADKNLNPLLWAFLLEKGYTTQQILTILKLGSLFSCVMLPVGLIQEFINWLPVQGTSPFKSGFHLTVPAGEYNYKRSDGSVHKGIDIHPNDSTNLEVSPIGPGKVKSVGFDEDGGYYAIIDHELSDGSHIYSYYGHLQEKPSLGIGDPVNGDTIIGKMGNTGAKTTGPHLHIQTYKVVNGKRVYINPRDIMDGGGDYLFVTP